MVPEDLPVQSLEGLRPLVAHLDPGRAGQPALRGHRCGRCGAVVLRARLCCPACGAVDGLRASVLSNRGQLCAWTRIHRSLPGVQVPYVSAVVELEGGGVLKGTLRGLDQPPVDPVVGLRVRVRFEELSDPGPAGGMLLSFFFVPDPDPAQDAAP